MAATVRTATKERPKPNGPGPAQMARQVQERERQATPQTPPQQKQEVMTFRGFQEELEARSPEIAALLPPTVDRKKFEAACIAAVKHRPELLQVNRRTLHEACTKAAIDGLLPDGREGVINQYNERKKVKRGNVEEWITIPTAEWIPMTYGVRKRAREVCGLIIDAQVVRAGDHFVWEQGDCPKIVHRPKLDGPRGDLTYCYAIIREQISGTPHERILHREVMTAEQVAKVKGQSKQPNGLMWGTFTDEAWRKSAVRRCIKTCPAVHSEFDKIERIASRDDDQYQFDNLPANGSGALNGAGNGRPLMPPMDDGVDPDPDAQEAPTNAPTEKPYLVQLDETLAGCRTKPELDHAWEMEERDINALPRDQQREAAAIYGKHEKRIAQEASEAANG